MDAGLRAALAQMASSITRASIALPSYSPTGGRVMLQVTGLENETLQGVELLLPYGRTAQPGAGDVVVFQVIGNRDHLVALGADNPATRIAGLVEGEFGDSDDQGVKIVWKRAGLVIDSSVPNLPITINAGSADITLNTTGQVIVAPSGTIVLAGGGPAVARVGDATTCPAGTGHITAGSSKVTSG
jgi:phage gp45-like